MTTTVIEVPLCMEIAQYDPDSGERYSLRLFRDGPALVWRGAAQSEETCLWLVARLSADAPQGPGELEIWNDREDPTDMTGPPDATHPVPTLQGHWRGVALLPQTVGLAVDCEQEVQ